MVNLIETLFGLAILSAIVALVLWAKRRRSAARRFGVGATVMALLAGILEIYIRIR